jgi:transcription antitermination factor NusG
MFGHLDMGGVLFVKPRIRYLHLPCEDNGGLFTTDDEFSHPRRFTVPILGEETTMFPDDLFDSPQASSADRNWYVFYTKARQEKAFARQLLSLQVPFFLPLVAKENLIRNRRVKSFIPVFGGYVFVFATEEERVTALTTNRVSTILDVTDQAQLVADLANVRRLIEADAPLTVERRILAGQRVRIKSGAMQGLEGIVEKRRGQSVLYVAVTMLQQSAVVEIDDFFLEPI